MQETSCKSPAVATEFPEKTGELIGNNDVHKQEPMRRCYHMMKKMKFNDTERQQNLTARIKGTFSHKREKS